MTACIDCIKPSVEGKIGMKIRKKGQNLQEMIRDLNRHGSEKKANVWKAVARSLNKPRRKRYEVGLNRINKNAKSRETIIVPGIVLGSGDIRKPLTVAALRFSGSAREKIEKAGGKCLEIQELLEKSPKGQKIRIMG